MRIPKAAAKTTVTVSPEKVAALPHPIVNDFDDNYGNGSGGLMLKS